MFISSTVQSAYKELKCIIDKILLVYMYMYFFLYIASEIAEILLIKKKKTIIFEIVRSSFSCFYYIVKGLQVMYVPRSLLTVRLSFSCFTCNKFRQLYMCMIVNRGSYHERVNSDLLPYTTQD